MSLPSSCSIVLLAAITATACGGSPGPVLLPIGLVAQDEGLGPRDVLVNRTTIDPEAHDDPAFVFEGGEPVGLAWMARRGADRVIVVGSPTGASWTGPWDRQPLQIPAAMQGALLAVRREQGLHHGWLRTTNGLSQDESLPPLTRYFEFREVADGQASMQPLGGSPVARGTVQESHRFRAPDSFEEYDVAPVVLDRHGHPFSCGPLELPLAGYETYASHAVAGTRMLGVAAFHRACRSDEPRPCDLAEGRTVLHVVVCHDAVWSSMELARPTTYGEPAVSISPDGIVRVAYIEEGLQLAEIHPPEGGWPTFRSLP